MLGPTALLAYIQAVRVVLPPVFLVGLMLGLPSTILPGLQSTTFGSDAFLIVGLLGAAKGGISLVLAPLIGVLSDKHGRKWTLLAVVVLACVPPIVMGVLQHFWVYCILDTMCGIYSAALSVLLASVADIVPKNHPDANQAHGFSVAMAGFAFGCGVGSAIGGAVGSPDAFRICAVAGAMAAACVLLLWPEDFKPYPFVAGSTTTTAWLPTASPRAATSTAAQAGEVSSDRDSEGAVSDDEHGRLINESKHAAGPPADSEQVAVPTPPELTPPQPPSLTPTTPGAPAPGASYAPSDHDHPTTILKTLAGMLRRILRAIEQCPNLRLCFVIVLLDSLAELTMVNLALLYLHDNLGFTVDDQLALVLVLGVSGVLCLLVVVPTLTRNIGTVRTLRWALIANSISIGMYAFVREKWQAIMLPLLCVLGAGVFPCTSAIAAASVTTHDDGLAQGVTSGARMLAEGLSPALLGVLFNVFKRTALPGAPFLVAGVCVIGAWAVTHFLRPARGIA